MDGRTNLSSMMDGSRIGVLTKGDLNIAKSASICPPENSTGVGPIFVVLNELEAQAISKSTTLATAVTLSFP
jgi:hypothetical protein